MQQQVPRPPKLPKTRAQGKKRAPARIRYVDADDPGRGGQPTLLTPELQDTIVNLIRAGNFFETACRVAGTDPRNALEWIARGEGRDDRPGKLEHIRFAEAIRKAQADAEALLVNDVRRAAQVDDKGQPRGSRYWAAALSMLERKFPARWGRRDMSVVRHEHDVLPPPLQAVADNAASPQDAEGLLERATAMLAYATRRRQKLLGPK